MSFLCNSSRVDLAAASLRRLARFAFLLDSVSLLRLFIVYVTLELLFSFDAARLSLFVLPPFLALSIFSASRLIRLILVLSFLTRLINLVLCSWLSSVRPLRNIRNSFCFVANVLVLPLICLFNTVISFSRTLVFSFSVTRLINLFLFALLRSVLFINIRSFFFFSTTISAFMESLFFLASSFVLIPVVKPLLKSSISLVPYSPMFRDNTKSVTSRLVIFLFLILAFCVRASRIIASTFALSFINLDLNVALTFSLRLFRFFRMFSSFSLFRVWWIVVAFILAEFRVLVEFCINIVRIFCWFSLVTPIRPIWVSSSKSSFLRISPFFFSASFSAFTLKALTFPGLRLNRNNINFLSRFVMFIPFRISSSFLRFSAIPSLFLCFFIVSALRFILFKSFTVLNSSMIALRSDTSRSSFSLIYV